MRSLYIFLTLLISAPAARPVWAAEKKQTVGVSDDTIHDQVQRKLADDALVKGGGIDVDVHDGVVTLKGKVADTKAKSKAEKLTKKVKGVTGVVNQLTVSLEANPQS